MQSLHNLVVFGLRLGLALLHPFLFTIKLSISGIELLDFQLQILDFIFELVDAQVVLAGQTGLGSLQFICEFAFFCSDELVVVCNGLLVLLLVGLNILFCLILELVELEYFVG